MSNISNRHAWSKVIVHVTKGPFGGWQIRPLSLPVPKSEAKEERVLLLVYLLVEVHVVDPSINWVLLGSDGAQT